MTTSRPLNDIRLSSHRYCHHMDAPGFTGTRAWQRKLRILVAAAIVALTCQTCRAQYVPLISGGAGVFTTTNGGNTSYIPTISPVLALPMTDRILIEAKADLLEDFFPRPHTGYDTQHFAGLSYLQADIQAAPKLTLTPGYFYTPFNTFTERLSPIWINDLVVGPIISTIGGGGSSLGAMVRGNAYQNDDISFSYAAYFSARSSNEQFSSARSSGGRLSVYLPRTGLEVGASFSRQLQKTQSNNTGVFVWWTPDNSRFRFRSEYAHAIHAQGYWFETAYQFTGVNSQQGMLARFEPLFRFQQTFRNAADPNDGLPSVNTQQADFGLDYALPHDFRIKTSYSRKFSSQGNTNIWETGLVYRFLFPAWRSR